jgi:hypothetical protein
MSLQAGTVQSDTQLSHAATPGSDRKEDEKPQFEEEPTPDHIELEMEQKERTIRGFSWFIVCISLYTTCFLYGLDTTIAADIQGPIIQAFG